MENTNDLISGFEPDDTSKTEEVIQQMPSELPTFEAEPVFREETPEEPVPVMGEFVKPEPQSIPTGEPASQRTQPAAGNGAPVDTQPGYQPRTVSFEPFPAYKAPRQKKNKPKSGGKAIRRVLCAVLALAVFVGGCAITANVVNSKWERKTQEMQNSFSDELSLVREQMDQLQDQIDGIDASGDVGQTSDGTITVVSEVPGLVYARNVDSVVRITCEITTTYYGQTTTGTSSGSGFVYSEDGYVVTNYHVVEGASSISFTTSDGTTYQAELVGYDDTNDVAVIKANATGLQPAKLGSSDELVVGDQVAAIGFPLSAQEATLTVGYISAKNRDVTTSDVAINMLQTDAAINSGNSGGPLFNMSGEVIGITTAKYSGTTSSGASIEGIGFAIPIDDVTGIISDLITYGYVNSAYLGVMVRNMTDTEQAAAALYNFPVGVYVAEVVEGNCAKAAGVKAGDIIIDLGGYEIESMTDLTRALRKFQGGDTTTITVFRTGDNEKVVLTITLDSKNGSTESSTEESGQSGEMPSDGSFDEWYDYFFGDKNG